jgi:hypothetical protein
MAACAAESMLYCTVVYARKHVSLWLWLCLLLDQIAAHLHASAESSNLNTVHSALRVSGRGGYGPPTSISI